MTRSTFAAFALAAGASLACSSDNDAVKPNGPQHPTLPADYTSNFTGAWYGTGTITMNGQTQTGSGYQVITRTGFNTLALVEMCPGVAGNAALDSATTFSMDPLTCPPDPQPCGPVTIAYKTGTGTVAGGTLTLSLTGTASGCGQSFSFTASFSGTLTPVVTDHGPPVAVVAQTNLTAAPGTPIALDASGSWDPDGRPLTFAWVVTSKPLGAAPALTAADTAVASFSSTTPGSYSVQVTVTASDLQTATASVDVTVGQPATPIVALPHEVAQARYSAALDRLVLTDGAPSALYLHDPATGDETAVALPLAPQCLSLSPDGTHALVGHDAWVSYVDLVGAKLEKKIPVSLDVGDCVLAGNGWAYLFPVSYSEALDSLEIATGVETRAFMIYEGSSGVLGADGLTMYAVTEGLSPAQIYRYDLSGGPAVEKWGSPYWGDHPMSAPMWLTADGARLITGAATAFRLSSVQAQDLLYGGTLSGMGSVKWLDASPTEIAAIANPGYLGNATDTAVELFNTEFLGHVDRITLPRWLVGANGYDTHGRFVFYASGGAKKYVIVQADGASGLLHDTAVLTY
jgi:chitinase